MATARVKLVGMASYTHAGVKLVKDKAVEISGESLIRHYEAMRGRVDVMRIADKKNAKVEAIEESKVPTSTLLPWSHKSTVAELRDALRSRDVAFGDETRAQLLAILQELEPSKGEG